MVNLEGQEKDDHERGCEENSVQPPWCKLKDPMTGLYYLHNVETGESTWLDEEGQRDLYSCINPLVDGAVRQDAGGSK